MKIKHLISAVAVFLALCLLPTAAFAEAAYNKVSLTVTAGGTGTVTVDSDYKLTATLPADGKVNTASIAATLIMQNIASLGIEGTRSYSASIVTGLGSREVNLKDHIGNLYGFGSAVANVTVDFENEVTYTASGSDDNVITATPDTAANASKAWQALASHVEVTTQSADDSYAILANGSYVKMGTEYLHFDENFSGNLKLDNVSDRQAIYQAIRNALVLETNAENQGSKVTAFVKAGTTLALGTTVATLKDDYVIELSVGDSVRSILRGIIESFRDCEGGTAILANALIVVNSLAGALEQDGSIDVSMHPLKIADYSFTLDLNDSININFYVKNVAESVDLEKFEVNYKFAGEETSTGSVKLSELTPATDENGKGQYKIVVAECAAKEMGDTVSIKVVYDGTTLKEGDISALLYCENTLKSSKSSDSLKALCTAALDYGAYAQTYFDYKTDSLVNENYTAGTVESTAIPASVNALEIAGSCDAQMSGSLSLESKTEIFFNVKPASGKTATLKLDDKSLGADDYTVDENGVIHVKVDGIAAKTLNKAFALSVTVDGETKTVTYSALSWAYGMQSNADAKKANLAKALYNYYVAAAAYNG